MIWPKSAAALPPVLARPREGGLVASNKQIILPAWAACQAGN